MLYINKQPCPPDIQADIERKTSSAAYRKISEVPSGSQAKTLRQSCFNKLNKQRLREALLEEQHGLCAYCMMPITNNGNITTIEHWYPLSKSRSKALDYKNFHAVCKGGSNIKIDNGEERVICCDAKKSNTVITLNPQNREMMNSIAYHDDGTIYTTLSDEERRQVIQADLDDVLALNGKKIGRRRADTTTHVVKGRRDTYTAIDEVLQEAYLQGTLDEELIDFYEYETTGGQQWEKFAGVSLYVLNQYRQLL